MKDPAEGLAGRVCLVNLEGLNALELTDEEGFDAVSFLHRGGFPELWRLRDLPGEAYFSSYVATYLERDVRRILNVGS